jgi:peptidoglycan L-alanyl-D-glutamate endopeptidase CwlK
MEMLRLGSGGKAVERLQGRLKDLGFNPGALDADFGPATEAAVIAFQKSEGLLADGVAGPRTLTALGLAKSDELRSAIPEVTPRIVSEMFPFTPVDNIKRNLPAVLQALADDRLGDKRMVLMALATIRAETEGFEPIDEGRSKFNSSPGGHPFDLYDLRKDLGNQGPPDGERYRGRGFVQLTGRFNYAKFGEALGLDGQLLERPELANQSDIAAKLLSAFLKDKERPIKEALLENDLRRARRLVNGGSHGLERFSETYLIGDRLLG